MGANGREKQAFDLLIEETVAMYHCFKTMVEDTHTGSALSTNELGVLLCLSNGPQTIPQIVKRSPFSRQYVQKVVQQLKDKAFIQRLENPKHKRSFLIKLTEDGENQMNQVRQEGYHTLERMRNNVNIEQVFELAYSLRNFRKNLERIKE
ncbi:MarR family winged helix-turn-helix transcriptional regulator [Halobacillus andaensis]|uniref:MarR family winged helix-turn-helix transcriptional regulator n=1 Tax=Halobacillus andaensis TaxID=1176239 RepID=UPI003D765389